MVGEDGSEKKNDGISEKGSSESNTIKKKFY